MEEENKKTEEKIEEKKVAEKAKEEKISEEKKKPEKKKAKDRAVVRGVNLPISQKISSAVCKMIKKKEISKAIEMLEEVLKFKRVVPMNNMEMPHRKGKGVMAGRYPLNVCKEFIPLLRQLKANASVNNLEEPVIIFLAKADKASCPFRREGRRAKRANVYLEARTKPQKNKEKKK